MKVKGIIVAAGYGSRFLPATKTIPKEMLPLIDRPAIDFIVEEFIQAGIREILIITSRRKKVLDDYFDREIELENVFAREKKAEKLGRIAPPDAEFFFVRQQEMKGTGHALLLAKPFTGEHPFVVAFPDDLIFSDTSLALQLIDAHKQTGGCILAVKNWEGRDVSRYGVVDPLDEGNPCGVRRLVEKPSPGKEPSKLVSFGRYLYTAELYPHLEASFKQHTGDDELYPMEAVNALAEKEKVFALDFKGERLDTGEPLGFLEAVCRYALKREDLADSAKRLFQELIKS